MSTNNYMNSPMIFKSFHSSISIYFFFQSPFHSLSAKSSQNIVLLSSVKKGILGLSFLFNVYFHFFSSYTHWISIYYLCVKLLSTSFLIISTWTMFSPQKSLPLNGVMMALRIFRAFTISMHLYSSLLPLIVLGPKSKKRVYIWAFKINLILIWYSLPQFDTII